MGTYDTRGGGPISPDIPDPFIFDEESEALGILEAAGVATAVNDKLVQLVARVCQERAANGDRIAELLKENANLKAALSSATRALDKEAEKRAGAMFLAYFIQNYPPDCIISEPAWHAPKIFRAALYAIEDQRKYVKQSPADG